MHACDYPTLKIPAKLNLSSHWYLYPRSAFPYPSRISLFQPANMVSTEAERYQPQRLSYFNHALAIHKVDFPIYYIECLSERHFIIAGGGGSSKTGVHNQINIMELVPAGNSCAADLILKFHTPEEIPDAIMNGSLMRSMPLVNTRLITGGQRPVSYHIIFNPCSKKFEINHYEILDDELPMTDTKCVKCTPSKLFAGTIDGHLTVWKVSSDDKRMERRIRAHSKEIDEVDIDPISKQIVTLSRSEGRCAVWNMSNLELVKEFKKDFINRSGGGDIGGAKLCYRSCRFTYDAITEQSETPQDSYLVIICNSVPKGSSQVFRWNTKNLEKSTSALLCDDNVMAMTVSLDGKFIGVGTRSGSVLVIRTKDFKRIYKINGAHTSAVTNLGFLTPKPESLSLTNCDICPLLSVSIDRRIVLHRPRGNSLALDATKIIVIVLIIYISFYILYKNYTD